MDSERKPPLHFANRLIRLMTDQAASETTIIEPHDFTVMRTLFRHAGGSWEKLSHGDIVHTRLLSTIVRAWAQMPGRKQETEVI